MARDISAISKRAFYMRAMGVMAARMAKRKVSKNPFERTVDEVLREYEPSRSRGLERFLTDTPSFPEFLVGRAGQEQRSNTMNMVSGLLTRDLHAPTWLIMGTLERAVAPYAPRTFLEIGSGTGSKLLYLLSRFPGATGVGLELTPSGVAVANAAADHYGLPARFYETDVSRGDWGVDKAHVVYSVHALEQMPLIASGVIDRMQAHAERSVVLIEPFPDFWDGIGGAAMRMRARHLDRLRSGTLEGRELTKAERIPTGNALNLPTEVHLLPRTPST